MREVFIVVVQSDREEIRFKNNVDGGLPDDRADRVHP